MSDLIAVITWWILVQIFGLVALPLAFRLFRPLPDRGYGISKALGMLLGSYVFWLLGMLGFLRNDSGAILFALGIAVGMSLSFYARRPALDGTEGAAHRQPETRLLPWLRTHWRLVFAIELIFASSLIGWSLYRAYVPRILTAGGEKFMELAFLNGFRRSDTLPPLDPWLAGYGISYYYFGYLMMSNLVRLSGVAPSVGFNVGGAMLFSLTVTGAFSLVYNLVASFARPRRDRDTGLSSDQGAPARPRLRRAWVGIALLGVVFVVLLGNLEGALEVAHWNGIGSTGFWKWLDIIDLDTAPASAADRANFEGRLVRPVTGPGWGWWWRGSRVISDYSLQDWPNRTQDSATPPPQQRENIDEFPFFSFLLGDMHPHVLALPFLMLALTVSLTLFHRGLEARFTSSSSSSSSFLSGTARLLGMPASHLLLFALSLGALGFLNTWDFPIQWVVAVGAYGLGRLTSQPEEPLSRQNILANLRPVGIVAIVLAVVGLLLYAPFYIGFQSQAGGVLVHVQSSTRLAQFVVMFGPLLLILIGFLVWGLRRAHQGGRLAWRAGLRTGAVLLGGALALLLLTALAIVVSPTVRGLVAPGMGDQSPGSIALRYLAMRLSAPWVTLLLAGMISATVALLQSGGFGRLTQFSLLLLGAGALMTFIPEYVYLKDVFGVRLNTIFKFYFQAWVLWAIASAGALYVLFFEADGLGLLSRRMFGAGVVLVAGLGLLYAPLAIFDRVHEFPEVPTLDGTAYLATEQPADYAAVRWLNDHVTGAPTILETHTTGAYAYEGRVSAQTGLPTLVGWGNHEWQWRGNLIVQSERYPVIEELYSTTDAQRTLTLLDEYDIRYVYVGPLERGKWPAAGLEKFKRLMETVYDRDGVTIYQRRVMLGGLGNE
jgi:YYY domain-containing protein